MTKPKASRTADRAKASSSAQPPAPAPAKPKGWALEWPPLEPGQTPDRLMAQVASAGTVGNARSLVSFGKATFGELSLTDCVKVLEGTAKSLNDGDLSAAVTLLSSQAVALNAMFGELARVGQANMFKAPEYADRYLRLAFKAQAQSRSTLETIAAIKNPPVVFARQANIAHGPQQVNNGPELTSTPASARTGETVSAPNEVLEDSSHGRTQLDPRAATATSRTHPQLEPVGALDRAEDPGG